MAAREGGHFFLEHKFGFSEKVVYLCTRELVTHKNIEIMGLIRYIQGYSAIIAVVLMPFLVKSRIPAYWVLYLLFCTILTPFIGYPLYRICILKR